MDFGTIALWIGRVLAAVLVIGVVSFAIGEGGPPNLLYQPLAVQLQFLFLGAVLCGLLAGMRWPTVGAVIVLVSLVCFDAVNLVKSGKLPGPWFHVFAIPTAFYLMYTWTRITTIEAAQD